MNKICKLHGSSLKSKPLDFKDFTKYKEFNNKLEKLFKNTSEPPSFKKSLRYLERYNKTFKYGIMDADEMRQIGKDKNIFNLSNLQTKSLKFKMHLEGF